MDTLQPQKLSTTHLAWDWGKLLDALEFSSYIDQTSASSQKLLAKCS
jgi:hypothetical protein